MKLGVKLLFSSLAVVVWPALSVGQGITGTVKDPQGGLVAGAQVEVSGPEGLVRRVRTKQSGGYEVRGLPPGEYTVQAFTRDFVAVSGVARVPPAAEVHLDLQFLALRPASAQVEVVGDPSAAVQEVPGSYFVVTKEELQSRVPADANEVLRQVPGVTLREDSGPAAMRLNVGIRGLNPDRSRQVLMLEDGLPIALAPYGEPEMYYSPPIDRMRAVEVLKGSGQIAYGPQTIGGVVNFVTPEPPPSTHGDLQVTAGQRGVFVANASLGGSLSDQSLGWFLGALRKQGDGFRDFFFAINDVNGKLHWRPLQRHQFALKFDWYDETSNSTYLGLTTGLFETNPNTNAVPHDRLRVARYSGALTHTLTLSPRAVLASTFFAYNTLRYWRRQDFDRRDLGRDYLGVLGDPTAPGGAIYLRDSAGNRNREFRVYGAQSNITAEHTLFGVRNKLDAGVRYVHEMHDDSFVVGPTATASEGVVRDDEDRFGRAWSGFLQNRFSLTSRLAFTPGIRIEQYRYTRHITRQRVGGVPAHVDIRNKDAVTEAIPGAGISYQATAWLTLFGGVHRGFAPPRVKDAINAEGESLQLDAELSWNLEAGARFAPHPAFSGELTFFRLDFANQIIPATQSGGATTTLVNAGATLHQGLEATGRVLWNELFGGRLLVHTEVRYMYLPVARFTQNALFEGHRLPYAPRHTLTFVTGVRYQNGYGFVVDATVVGDQFGDNAETVTPSADGTIGLVPRYTVWNATLDYTIRHEGVQLRPFVTVKNLANATYIASRAPEGIYPGPFRQVNAGVKISF